MDREIAARRWGRIALGGILVVVGLLLAFNAGLGFPVRASTLIYCGWIAGIAAAGTVYVLAHFHFVHFADVGRIEDRRLALSLALPVTGLSLVLPLTIHATLLGHASSFDDWVVWSCLLVGHCHVALALLGAWRMVRLAQGATALKPAGMYGVTVALAMAPGGLFLLIPPFLVAATGLAFLFVLWLPTRIIARERALLAVDP